MFRFDFRKTMHAVAHLLRDEPSKRMNYMRLIKLLYIADRQSVAETGRPITGDTAVAMDRGPVLSHVYDLVRGSHAFTPEWSGFFRRVGYELQMIEDPGNSHLSRYEARKLTHVKEQYADKDEWDLARETHCFDEWRKNQPEPGSSRNIAMRDIFEAVGKIEEYDQVQREVRAQYRFTKLL